jgi:hypothetical protein
VEEMKMQIAKLLTLICFKAKDEGSGTKFKLKSNFKDLNGVYIHAG